MNACNCCFKTKAPYTCGLCQGHSCKSCAHFVDENEFSYFASLPEVLSHDAYCAACFEQKVQPVISQYEETMEKAKDVFVFSKSQTKETRLMGREALPITVDSRDRQDAVLRLAFLAVHQGYNAIIDVDLHSKKSTETSYKIVTWTGKAIPTNVDAEKLNRQISF